MRPFECACGARVFFENTSCLSCGRELGFLPDIGQMGVFDASTDEASPCRTPVGGVGSYRKCGNYSAKAVCNWMVPEADSEPLCQACRLNFVIPDLSEPQNQQHWASVESAKRRLIYTLNRLRLPVVSKVIDPKRGLAFDIKNDTGEARVMTGHDDGLITLNLKEADPVLREKARLAMNERYRTLLGHFRHEIGHYYWDLLVRESTYLTRFRELFGDEQADYAKALERHYAREASEDWKGAFVSVYATSHPWEDWAETWAHYLLMVDTLETANAHGVSAPALPTPADPTAAGATLAFEPLVAQWLALTVILNALSRSTGHEDLYPFEIGEAVQAKLAFIHQMVMALPAEPRDDKP